MDSFPKRRVLLVQYTLPHYRKPFFKALRESLSPSAELDLQIRSKRDLIFSLQQIFRRPQPASMILNFEITNGVSWMLLIAARLRLLSSRVILWGCGYEPPRGVLMNELRRAVYRWMGNLASTVVSYSEAAKEFYQKAGIARPIHVAYNSIDEREIIEAMARLKDEELAIFGRERGLDNSFNVLFIGRLIPEKRLVEGMDILQEVVRRGTLGQRPLKLIIIGTGSEFERLQSHSKQMSYEVLYAGEILDKEKIAPYAKWAQVFFLPGTGGLAINEAMGFQLPVVCSLADGTASQLIRDGWNGFVIRGDSGDRMSAEERRQFVEAIEVFTRNPARSKEFGRRSLERIQNEINLDRMVGTFHQALEIR